MRKLFIIAFILSMFTVVLAQDTTGQHAIVNIPEGFNWLYVVFFSLGMLIHYAKKVLEIAGKTGFWSGLVSNFVGWFFNQSHRTILAGAVVAIMGLAESIGLKIGFGELNALGIFISLISGYVGDSACNAGTITKQP